jgi:hypothetical protein
VSPGVLNLGNCKVGDPAQVRRVVVRASKPFKLGAGLGYAIKAVLLRTASVASIVWALGIYRDLALD